MIDCVYKEEFFGGYDQLLHAYWQSGLVNFSFNVSFNHFLEKNIIPWSKFESHYFGTDAIKVVDMLLVFSIWHYWLKDEMLKQCNLWEILSIEMRKYISSKFLDKVVLFFISLWKGKKDLVFKHKTVGKKCFNNGIYQLNLLVVDIGNKISGMLPKCAADIRNVTMNYTWNVTCLCWTLAIL